MLALDRKAQVKRADTSLRTDVELPDLLRDGVTIGAPVLTLEAEVAERLQDSHFEGEIGLRLQELLEVGFLDRRVGLFGVGFLGHDDKI